MNIPYSGECLRDKIFVDGSKNEDLCDKIFADGSKSECSRDEIFTDAGLPYRMRTQLCLIQRFYFADVRQTVESVKILSRKNFPLYSSQCKVLNVL